MDDSLETVVDIDDENDTGSVESSEPVSWEPPPDPVEHIEIDLDDGTLVLHGELTIGDVLICFCLLLILVSFVSKWLWESVKNRE